MCRIEDRLATMVAETRGGQAAGTTTYAVSRHQDLHQVKVTRHKRRRLLCANNSVTVALPLNPPPVTARCKAVESSWREGGRRAWRSTECHLALAAVLTLLAIAFRRTNSRCSLGVSENVVYLRLCYELLFTLIRTFSIHPGRTFVDRPFCRP